MFNKYLLSKRVREYLGGIWYVDLVVGGCGGVWSFLRGSDCYLKKKLEREVGDSMVVSDSWESVCKG